MISVARLASSLGVRVSVEVITTGVESFAKLLEELAANGSASDQVQRVSMRVEAAQLRTVAANLRGAFALGPVDEEPQT